MRRRRPTRSPELTPLIDVLFILLFAALIQARSVVTDSQLVAEDRPAVDGDMADAGPLDAMPDAMPDAGPVDAMPVDAGPDAGPDAGTAQRPDSAYQVRSRQLASTMARSVYGRNALVVDIRSDAVVTGITNWLHGQKIGFWTFEHNLTFPDSEVRVRPREPGDPGQLCPFVRTGAHVDDEDEMLILVVLDKPLDELELAVSRALHEGLEDCFATARGVVVFVQPDSQLTGQAGGDVHEFE